MINCVTDFAFGLIELEIFKSALDIPMKST
jgi:hypothetical protein